MSHKTPAQYKPGHRSNFYEDRESTALWNWAQMFPVLREHLYHIPNGGNRNPREGARMKGMGVRAGVHDYHLPVPRGGFHGLWVELKATPPNAAAVSVGQKEWEVKMRDLGHAVYICKGWETAMKVFRWYLAMPPVPVIVECPPLESVLKEMA